MDALCIDQRAPSFLVGELGEPVGLGTLALAQLVGTVPLVHLDLYALYQLRNLEQLVLRCSLLSRCCCIAFVFAYACMVC